jgi:uncharacterized protein (DUF362 family)
VAYAVEIAKNSKRSGRLLSESGKVKLKMPNALQTNWVFCAQAPLATYDFLADCDFPELPKWAMPTTSLRLLRSLLGQAGLDLPHQGSSSWNPLGDIIGSGQKVVVKPNWVHHQNGSGCGLESLVTHTSVLEAVLHYVAQAHPASIVLGDAPVQGCDFPALMTAAGVPEMVERFSRDGVNIELKDFRRTINPNGRLGTRAREECRSLDEYVLYDLGTESFLEEITTPNCEFRVTMYNPDLLKRTHGPGKHQYLIARDVIESDVVINVPKLKTHKKACITGALKNLVGINGHKEYLPHHRKGGPRNGGDCYPERSYTKSLVEDLLDLTNKAHGRLARLLSANAARAGVVFGKLLGLDNNYEGSWYGNDTVWRMSLDLQRVLRYGKVDGTLADVPQRTVLSVTDAIIAGQGDGPLSPTPIELGMMTLGMSPAAVEWVNALLMGLSPDKIPITRGAFAPHRYRLTEFTPNEIEASVDGQPVKIDEMFARYGRSFQPPKGWESSFGLAAPGRSPQPSKG